MFRRFYPRKKWQDEIPAENDPALVGQSDFMFLIPDLHRGLANPSGITRFPKLRNGPPFSEPTCAFWETALYLLSFLLGWSDPGAGLQWWHLQKRETFGDVRLEALLKIWAADPFFDLFVAWCWTQSGQVGPHLLQRQLLDLHPGLSKVEPPSRALKVFSGQRWASAVEALVGAVGWSALVQKVGGNNLHLGLNYSRGAASDEYKMTFDIKDRHAVLVLDDAFRWFCALMTHGGALPELEGHSWRVDVVVKPIGWLGTFRRSRVTGLWFQGKHSLHMAGQIQGL